jgi:hypothetical protein
MDGVSVFVVFVLFSLGLVLALQGFIGKEINPDGQPLPCAGTSSGPASAIRRSAIRFDCFSSAWA